MLQLMQSASKYRLSQAQSVGDQKSITMAGKRSSLSSFFGIRKGTSRVEAEPRQRRPQKIRLSDEDRGRHWYAEPDIDEKAKQFITKVHRDMETKETA